ncbi:hypothetical protein ACFJIS_19060 [Variovorax boronicumulans]|uniref:hypothetical protein n=1 Tax=Variovorax boronicumulans TaxID=436515 RepID=UPI0036F38A98
MKNTRLVHFLLLVWALVFVKAVYAAGSVTSLSLDVRSWDYESLLWGAIAGFLGGALRTIFTLASENVAVYRVLREARKDLIVSFLAGGLAYLIIIAVSSKLPELITREIRMVVIVWAGWQRIAFFKRVDQLVTSKLDKFNQDLRGGAPADPPASDVVSLGDK